MKRNAEILEQLQRTPPWEWPDHAGATLLAVVRDRRASEEERVLAAELAGESVFVDDALAKALVAVVGSAEEPEELRATSAIALGPVLELCDTEGFDEDDDMNDAPISERTFGEVRQALRATYENPSTPKLVRRRVLEGAVRAPQDWQREAIRVAYATDDPEWRLTAVFCMRFVQGFDEQILASLESPDVEVEAEAVRGAGEWELKEAAPHVLRLLANKDTDKDLLVAAITAVATVSRDRALELLPDFEDSDDPDIAEAAEEATQMAQLDWNAAIDDGEEEEDEDDGLP